MTELFRISDNLSTPIIDNILVTRGTPRTTKTKFSGFVKEKIEQ